MLGELIMKVDVVKFCWFNEGKVFCGFVGVMVDVFLFME